MTEPEPLHAAAQRKRAATLARAVTALTEMTADGSPITFQSVAARAAVSRQWLYRQPELRDEIEQLRHRSGQGVPARQRTSDASLQQRLRTALDENQTLREDNHRLKRELALAYGAQRAPAALVSAQTAPATATAPSQP